MPNLVQAAAEGMPTLTRRTALAMTSTGIATAITVLSSNSPSAAAEVSPELERLIAAKDAAYHRFEEAIAAASRAEEAYFTSNPKELFANLSIGGSQSFRPDFDRYEEAEIFDGVRADIVERYDEQRRKLAGLYRLNASVAEGVFIELQKGQARDLRALRKLLKAEITRRKETGFWQAEEERSEAGEADDAALVALCAYRCRNMAEVARRAEVLAPLATPYHGGLTEEASRALFASMAQAGKPEPMGDLWRAV